MRLSTSQALRRTARQFPLLLYLGAIALITAILAGGLLAQGACRAAMPDWVLVLIGILSAAGHQSARGDAGELAGDVAGDAAPAAAHGLFRRDSAAVAHVWWWSRRMLTSAENIEDLVEALEVRFLANRDANLHFRLLTDFRDAQQETLPEDGPLLQLAARGSTS